MVCEYCRGDTRVINSRRQNRSNQVWRRRKCSSCGAIFTTHEAIYLPAAISVKKADNISAFEPDRIFAELITDLPRSRDVYMLARELSATITRNLIKNASDGLILAQDISQETAKVLKRFDKQTWHRYIAEHPSLQN